jgi:hypothetical protein
MPSVTSTYAWSQLAADMLLFAVCVVTVGHRLSAHMYCALLCTQYMWAEHSFVLTDTLKL